MPKISIIVPVYNVEKYLSVCLDSLLSQTLTDIEIICVNDGSTDGSLHILSEYAKHDSRIMLINKANEGAAAARNTGMIAAHGEYIGFVDSDDWVDKDYFEKLYHEAVVKNADIARAPYNYSYRDYEIEERNLKPVIKEKYSNNENLDVNDHSVVIWNAIYKKDFLKRNNIMFFDELPCANDISFTARTTFLSEKTVPVIGTNYHYRQNVDNQLTTPSVKRIMNTVTANNITLNFINDIVTAKNDYVKAYQRCIWRYDDIFKRALYIDGFDTDKQDMFIDSFIDAIKNFKYDKSLLYDTAGVCFLEKSDKKSYVDFCNGKVIPCYYVYKFLSKITIGKHRKIYKTLYKSMKRYYKNRKRG